MDPQRRARSDRAPRTRDQPARGRALTLATLLLIEAARASGDRLAEQLMADGYRVELARTVAHARVLAGTGRPDALLLGSAGAGHAPHVLLREVRAARPGSTWWARVPAIALGRVGDELELVRCFEAGADDFVSAPVPYLELRLRVRALLRRAAAFAETPSLAVGPLAIDARARTATLRGVPVELRRREFDLLVQLARDPLRVFTRRELLERVWGYRATATTRTLDSHASRLRRRLADASAPGGPDPLAMGWVRSVRGVGYRLI